jgi:CMP-N-acetylneuraminic acid synthetase
MRTLALIPARSGSKGIKDKNIYEIRGKTLLELAVETGISSLIVDDVYVSTDSQKYEDIALQVGAKSLGLRKASLSGDNVSTVDVVLDFIESFDKKIDIIVLLQATSPIRTSQQVDEMISILLKENADSIVSVSQVEEPHPHKMKKLNSNGFVVPFLDNSSSEVPRQHLEKLYALTGSIYVVRTSALIQNKSFFSSKTLPYVVGDFINIDSEDDIQLLEYKLSKEKVNEL